MSGIIDNKYSKNLFLIILIFFYIFGFILNEDGSGSGEYDYLNYLLIVQSELSNNFRDQLLNKGFVGYNPLHFLIYYPVYSILGFEYLRIINFIVSLILILIFFNLLKKRFPEVNNDKLILISFLPTLDPYFRASAFWFQNEVTALLFFLISINFFLNYKKKKRDKKYVFYMFVLCFSFLL